MARKSPTSTKKKSNGNGAIIGFEQQLWDMADRMRGHMDPSEYKHVALGLIFLKYVTDAFQEVYDRISADEYADPEDRDEYAAENAFWVPKEARWSEIQAKAKTPEIGNLIDAAMLAIEKENPGLKGVMPREYGRPSLNKERLGELIDLISNVDLVASEEQPPLPEGEMPKHTHRSLDVIGRVYEYFLQKFAGAEGKSGGEFYTPRSIVRLLVEMIVKLDHHKRQPKILQQLGGVAPDAPVARDDDMLAQALDRLRSLGRRHSTAPPDPSGQRLCGARCEWRQDHCNQRSRKHQRVGVGA